MKIPLNVSNMYGGVRAIASVMIRGPRFAGIISLVVDTGSPHTILGSMDVLRLNIPISNLPSHDLDKDIVGLNNQKIDLKLAKDTNFSFAGLINGERKSKTIVFSVYVNADKIVPIRGQKIQGTPSVLGVDFLLKNKLKFIFDPNNEEAYLEGEN